MHMKFIASAALLTAAFGLTGFAHAQDAGASTALPTMIGSMELTEADAQRVLVRCQDLETRDDQAAGAGDAATMDADNQSAAAGSVDLDTITLELCTEAGFIGADAGAMAAPDAAAVTAPAAAVTTAPTAGATTALPTMIGTMELTEADAQRVLVRCEDLETRENQAEGAGDADTMDADNQSAAAGSVDLDTITLELCTEAGFIGATAQ